MQNSEVATTTKVEYAQRGDKHSTFYDRDYLENDGVHDGPV